MAPRYWYIVVLNGLPLRVFLDNERVAADRFRSECGELARVVPVLPMDCQLQVSEGATVELPPPGWVNAEMGS